MHINAPKTSLERARCCSDRAVGKAPPGPPGGSGVTPQPHCVSSHFPQRSEWESPTYSRSVPAAESTGQRRAARRGEPLSPRSFEQRLQHPGPKRRWLLAGHPASLSRAVASPRLPPVPDDPAAPGQPDRDTQKPLPSRGRAAVAILTCSEQAHSREAAGYPPPLCGAAEQGYWGGQGFTWAALGMSPSLPAGFLDTCPGTQSTGHRQGKENQ